MRLRLILTVNDPINKTIPVNYQYPLSSWIYHTIAEGNHEFAEYLHNTGFTSGSKSYKLFTFSQLSFPRKGFKVEKDRLHILSRECSFVISFMVPTAIEHFITGLFANQHFVLGDQFSKTPFKVSAVEALPDPVFSNNMKLRFISPLVIGKQLEHCPTAEYLSPEHTSFNQILGDNLINKYAAAIQAGLILIENVSPDFEAIINTKLLNTPRKWGITIKANTTAQTKIIGYTFDFSLTAPEELIKIGYWCGFGEKNAMGMGCVEAI